MTTWISFSDFLTVTQFKKYHSQIIRKLNLLITKQNSIDIINDENSILPVMPIETVEGLEEFESLLRNSDVARKEYVSITHKYDSSLSSFI